jgi:DNA-binding PadR family transcriptional regulator
MPPTPAELAARLPLQPAEFHVLVVLAETERHGYAINQEIETRTNNAVSLSAGTLYRTIQRLLDDGLIVESRRRPAKTEDDERRRYYRITPFGTAVARAETARLANLVRLAKVSGIAPLAPATD